MDGHLLEVLLLIQVKLSVEKLMVIHDPAPLNKSPMTNGFVIT